MLSRRLRMPRISKSLSNSMNKVEYLRSTAKIYHCIYAYIMLWKVEMVMIWRRKIPNMPWMSRMP